MNTKVALTRLDGLAITLSEVPDAKRANSRFWARFRALVFSQVRW